MKTSLRNRMGDQYMSNSLICYVEKEKMLKVTNVAEVDRFKKNERSQILEVMHYFHILSFFSSESVFSRHI